MGRYWFVSEQGLPLFDPEMLVEGLLKTLELKLGIALGPGEKRGKKFKGPEVGGRG